MDAWRVCQVYLASEEAQVVSTGIKIRFKVSCEGNSQVWDCQVCLVQLLGQRESSRAQAMDTALAAGLQGKEVFVCFAFPLNYTTH